MDANVKDIIKETVKEVLSSEDYRYSVIAEDIRIIKQDLVDLKVKSKAHILNCPQDERIKDIEDNLFEYNIVKKYPKLVVSIFLMITVLSVLSYLNSL